MRLSAFKKEIEDIQPGETIRVNHGTHCKAGNETRRRLYLTRTLANPKKTVGYCHNCQEGGVFTDDTFAQYRDGRHMGTPPWPRIPKIVESVDPPSNLITRLVDFPTHAQAWVLQNRLSQEDLSMYGIAFDTSSDRVYLPHYASVHPSSDVRAGQHGYQLRLTHGTGPKYTTVRHEDSLGYTMIRPTVSNVTCVVEDLVSGIHVAAAGFSVLVNYGVKINPLAVKEVSRCSKVVVWLDNDSSYIKDQAQKYARTIKLYGGKETAVITDATDPKHHTKEEITKRINNAWIV